MSWFVMMCLSIGWISLASGHSPRSSRHQVSWLAVPGWSTDLTGLTEPEARALLAAGSRATADSLGMAPALASGLRKLLSSMLEQQQTLAVRAASRVLVRPEGFLSDADDTPDLGLLQQAVFGGGGSGSGTPPGGAGRPRRGPSIRTSTRQSRPGGALATPARLSPSTDDETSLRVLLGEHAAAPPTDSPGPR